MDKSNQKIVPSGLIQVWDWQDANRRRFTDDAVSKSIHDFLAYAKTLPLDLRRIVPYTPPALKNDMPAALKQVWEWKDSCYKTVAPLPPKKAIHTLLEKACHVAESRTKYKKGKQRNSKK